MAIDHTGFLFERVNVLDNTIGDEIFPRVAFGVTFAVLQRLDTLDSALKTTMMGISSLM